MFHSVFKRLVLQTGKKPGLVWERVNSLLFLRTKTITKKEMNKCMAEIYDPGRIRTRAARFICQYHNH